MVYRERGGTRKPNNPKTKRSKRDDYARRVKYDAPSGYSNYTPVIAAPNPVRSGVSRQNGKRKRTRPER